MCHMLMVVAISSCLQSCCEDAVIPFDNIGLQGRALQSVDMLNTADSLQVIKQ